MEFVLRGEDEAMKWFSLIGRSFLMWLIIDYVNHAGWQGTGIYIVGFIGIVFLKDTLIDFT